MLLREDTPGKKRLVADVSPEAVAASSQSALLEKCRKRLPSYMVPSAVVGMAEWPRTTSGKLNREALLALPMNEEDGDSVEWEGTAKVVA